jgi:hypothetical protein
LQRPLIGLITDQRKVSRWQAEALEQLGPGFDYVVLDCTSARSRKKPFAHAFYYALNLASLKPSAGPAVPLPKSLPIVKTIAFDADADGAWQKIPEAALREIERAKPQLIVKFGMRLLRVPPTLEIPILSYHHGDPRRFRGRPAGFYELLSGEPMIGQVVQILSNRLDAGKIVAFGQSRACRHSYRATMSEAYRRSPLLLPEAVRNCLRGRTLPIEPGGTNYRLPANATVFKFWARLLKAKVRRLLFGLFVEKQWEVAQAADPGGTGDVAKRFPQKAKWETAKRPARYRFLADPFPHPKGGLLVEALRRWDEQGEILHLDDDGEQVLCAGQGHFSYPGTVSEDGAWFIVPETAEWGTPRIFGLNNNGADAVGELNVEGAPRLIDPTLFRNGENLFLFANTFVEGSGVLRLWISAGLFERFAEHPASPIRISPAGARMGGAIMHEGQRLVRLGQDGSRDYGNGLLLFEIERLTPTDYSEREVDSLYFAGVKGPHTLNLANGKLVFDFYREKVTPFAGVRRLRAAASKRRARR